MSGGPVGLSGSAAGRTDGTLAIVVVNFHAHALLRVNLAGRCLDGPDVRVVIVDNSTDVEERDAARLLCREQGWTLVPMPENVGFGAGVNAGVSQARLLGCVTFLCLNPDAVLTPDVLAQLRDHSLRHPMSLISPEIVDSAGSVVFRGSRLSMRDGRIRGQRVGDSNTAPPGWIPWLTGACLVVHEELWDRVQGFDEQFFLYWEDVDFSFRCLGAGGQLVVRDDLKVVHDEGGTQQRSSVRAKSALYYRWNARNRLAFASRHLSRRQLLRWMACTPAVSWEILMRGGRAQLLRSSAPLRAAVGGSAAGLGLALRALIGGSGTFEQTQLGSRRPSGGGAL